MTVSESHPNSSILERYPHVLPKGMCDSTIEQMTYIESSKPTRHSHACCIFPRLVRFKAVFPRVNQAFWGISSNGVHSACFEETRVLPGVLSACDGCAVCTLHSASAPLGAAEVQTFSAKKRPSDSHLTHLGQKDSAALSLAYASVGDDGCTAIARYMRENVMLRTLDLRGNNIRHLEIMELEKMVSSA
eukprot:s875_g2.t1